MNMICFRYIMVCVALWSSIAMMTAAEVKAAVHQELTEKTFLFEVVRYLYRWYLDETDAEKIVEEQDVLFWVRAISPKLDPGDKSEFGEIVMPQLNVSVAVKKADYAIEELGVVVKNNRYKITNVARGSIPESLKGYKEVKASCRDMQDYVFRTRSQAQFPEDDLLMRIRLAAREEIREYLQGREKASFGNRIGTWEELLKQDLILHLSPISPVANELWIFWESGRMLVRFASDIDLENSALWEHEELAVELFNIDEQTVVSLNEVAGSNAYMTRDQVGRALFNCIVLGKRLVITPLGAAKAKKTAPAN